MTDQSEFKREVAGYSDLALKRLERHYANDQRTASQRLAVIRKELKHRNKHPRTPE